MLLIEKSPLFSSDVITVTATGTVTIVVDIYVPVPPPLDAYFYSIKIYSLFYSNQLSSLLPQPVPLATNCDPCTDAAVSVVILSIFLFFLSLVICIIIVAIDDDLL